MATVATAAVPARKFALHATHEAVPEFECERIVETGDRTVVPLVGRGRVSVGGE